MLITPNNDHQEVLYSLVHVEVNITVNSNEY